MSHTSTRRAAPAVPDEGPRPPEPSDREVLQRFARARDEDAFTALVQRYGGMVWGVCRRLLPRVQDAEDAFQAVFLVLAAKPAAIRNSEAVGGWLYGVAYRTAMKARRNAARRKARERQPRPSTPAPAPPSEAAFRELQKLLDEQVQRLPEKYRVPFVLCCLQGLSKGETARELGWKEGTVASRVAQARKLLEKRLARRGVTLSALLTAGVLAPGSAGAAPAAPLLRTTIEGALAPPAERRDAGVSTQATALAESMLRLLAARRRAHVALVALALLLLAGAGLAAFRYGSGTPAETPVRNEPETFLPPATILGTPVDEQSAALAFAPDGKRLVAGSGRGPLAGQLKIWEMATRQELVGLQRLPGVQALAYSPGGQTLLSGDRSGTIHWRDPETAEEHGSVQAHAGGVRSLCYSSDGALLASAGMDGTVQIWDAQTRQPQAVFADHGAPVLSVAFFPQRRAVVSGGLDHTARIREIGRPRASLALVGHRAPVEGVAVSPDGRVVATAAGDAVKLWNAESGVAMATLDEGQAYGAVAFSPDGQALAGAGADGTIRLWDAATHELLASLAGHRAPVWALAFAPDGTLLASGSADRTVKIWNLRTGTEETALAMSWSGIRAITALAYAPDGAVLGVATKDNTVHLRDARSGDVLMVLEGQRGESTCLSFAPDGQTLAGASTDGAIRLWDRTTGKKTGELKGHVGPVRALVFAAEGTLISAGDDGTIRFWQGTQLAELPAHPAPILALALDPVRHQLASAGAEGTIKLWDCARRTEIGALAGHQGAVRALACAPDGSLASAGDDATVRVWEPDGRSTCHVLGGHAGPVRALAIAPGGRALVSGGHDGKLQVWDPAHGGNRGVLAQHTAAVTALAMQPQGEDVISGGDDTLLLRWRSGQAEAPRPAWLVRTTADPSALQATHWIGLLAAPFAGPLLVTSTLAPVPTPTLRRIGDRGMILIESQPGERGKGEVNLKEVHRNPALFKNTCAGCHQQGVEAAPAAGPGNPDTPPARPGGTRRHLWTLALLSAVLVILFAIARRRRRRDDTNSTSQAVAESPAPAVAAAPPPARDRSRARLGWIVGVGLAILLLAACLFLRALLLPAPGETADDKEITVDFRGQPVARELTFNDPEGRFLHTEPNGLRLTLPKEEAEHTRVGLHIPTALPGDFTATLTFESFQTTQPPVDRGGYGVGFLFRANTDVGIGRFLQGASRQVLLADQWSAVNGQREPRAEFTPCTATSGRVRLQRTGTTMRYLWSPELTGDHFEEIWQCAYDEEVSAIRLIGEAGQQACDLDVRFSELRIRGPGAALLDALPARSRRWLWLAAALGAGVLVLGSAAVWRQRRRTAPAAR